MTTRRPSRVHVRCERCGTRTLHHASAAPASRRCADCRATAVHTDPVRVVPLEGLPELTARASRIAVTLHHIGQ